MGLLDNNAYTKRFQINPIILTSGIAGNEEMPISKILMPIPRSPNPYLNKLIDVVEEPFAYFKVLSGTSLLSYSIGEYPFYNGESAANSAFKNPNIVSFLMTILPSMQHRLVNQQYVMTNLKQKFEEHIKKSGLFTLITPFYIYEKALFLDMAMVDYAEETNLLQTGVQLNFRVPLVDLESARAVYNEQMDKTAKGLPQNTTTKLQALSEITQ